MYHAPTPENGETNSTEPIEVTKNILAPTPLKIDLRDAHAMRRELASVYRDMRSGKIEIQDGARLAYVLDLIRKAIETSVLQMRLEILEQTLKIRNDKL